jgi:uncharacterized delta-60 repeat protein
VARLLRFAPALAAVAAALLLWVAPAAAAPGELDTGFGNGGKVAVTLGQSGAYNDVALQPDGKIVLVGYDFVSDNNSDFAVTRLNANGSVDTGFGSAGTTLIGFVDPGDGTPLNDVATSVALRSDGKILVAGATSTGNGFTIAALARLNPDGTPDGSFGGGLGGRAQGPGRAIVNLPGLVSDLALDAQGRIVLAGTSSPTPGGDGSTRAFLARADADAVSLDSTFGTRGTAVIGFGGDQDGLDAMALQPDGKIVAVGYTDSSAAIGRVTPSGAADTSFAVVGNRAFVYASGGIARDVVVEPDGDIDVAGKSRNLPGFDVTRLSPAGNFVNTLDGQNTAGFTFGADDDADYAIALQANGKILLAGTSGRSFAVGRLQPGGVADTTFGPGGMRTVPFGGLRAIAFAMVLQPDGKVVLAGQAGSGGGVARLQGDSSAAGGGPGGSGAPSGGGGSSPGSRAPSALKKVPRCGGKPATIVGTDGKDKLKGTKRADVIVGLGGDDTISGGGGNDVICGGRGNDKISGGAGADKLYGDAGKDKLNGGAGQDKLNGGAGKDSLNGGAGKDSCSRTDIDRSC